MKKLAIPALILTLATAARAATPQAPVTPGPAPDAKARTVLVLVYDGVELGDLAAPVEVFKVASELGQTPSFQIKLAAEKPGPVRVDGGFTIQADCVLAECPAADLLVLAGGRGALEALNRPALIDWVRQRSGQAETVLGICTGTFLLAKAGLLDGVQATTHKQGINYLKRLAPKSQVEAGRRYIQSGKIVTTSGVSSSIDASLQLVAKYLGAERARAAAEWLDHPWQPAAS